MQSHCIGIGSGSLGSGNNKVGDWNDKQTGDPSPSTTGECKADGQLKKTSPKNRCSLRSKITDSIHRGFLLPMNVPGMVWTLVSLSWIIKTSKQAGEPSQLQIICAPSHSRDSQGHWGIYARFRNNNFQTFLCHLGTTFLALTDHSATTRIILMCAFRKNRLFSMLVLKCLPSFNMP